MYSYRNLNEANVGDIVEAKETELSLKYPDKIVVEEGRLYEILPGSDNNSIGQFREENGELSGGINVTDNRYWKLLRTYHSETAKRNDGILMTRNKSGVPYPKHLYSKVLKVIQVDETGIYVISELKKYKIEFKDCTVVYRAPDEEPVSEKKIEQKKKLSFYKRSGKPWTSEEYTNILRYSDTSFPENRNSYLDPLISFNKYIYDGTDSGVSMYAWSNQMKDEDLSEFEILAYEDVFEPKTTKGNKMQNDEIKIIVNGNEVSTSKTKKELTDLQQSKKHNKIHAVFFNQSGARIGDDYFKNEEAALDMLSTKEYIGCTVTVYKQTKTKKQKLQFKDA